MKKSKLFKILSLSTLTTGAIAGTTIALTSCTSHDSIDLSTFSQDDIDAIKIPTEAGDGNIGDGLSIKIVFDSKDPRTMQPSEIEAAVVNYFYKYKLIQALPSMNKWTPDNDKTVNGKLETGKIDPQNMVPYEEKEKESTKGIIDLTLTGAGTQPNVPGNYYINSFNFTIKLKA